MKFFTIIAGVDGTGKSSLTSALKAERTDLGYIIDVDKLAAQHSGDYLAVERINDCIKRGVCFTQETTLSSSKTARTIRQAKEDGYFIRLYYIGLDTAEESQRRIANRVAKGGHNIPAEDVQHRFDSRFEALAQVLPYCDEVNLFDNDNGFIKVAEYRNGELIPIGNIHPRWLSELESKLNAAS